ncbi:hypothetical protein RGU13_19385 [Sphingomonas sp. 10B4]|nr:hypothetical protein [Sphingomonas sp. 10B4]MDY7526186.1 hypothetical protein [Sphingomonas sp. 10B4]MEB0284288.1 hypothetical protein [Sphingomonas sp. 10B4]
MGCAPGSLARVGDLSGKPCLLLPDAHAEHGNGSALAGEGEQRLAVETAGEEDDRPRMAGSDRASELADGLLAPQTPLCGR